MSARLASGIWVSAYLARLRLADIPAYVVARGDDTAGAVLVKQAGGKQDPSRSVAEMADDVPW